MPNVTTKLGICMTAHRKPLTRPTTMPMHRHNSATGTARDGSFIIICAATTSISTMTAATDRSSPPIIITMVWPIATRIIGAACRVKSSRCAGLTEFGDTKPSITTSRSRPQKMMGTFSLAKRSFHFMLFSICTALTLSAYP